MSTTSERLTYLHEEEQSTERFEPETPFLDTRFSSETWAEREAPVAFSADEKNWVHEVETPFLAEYHGETPVNQEAQALEQTLMELFDREFNEAVSSLALEASAQAEYFSRGATEQEAESLLNEWLDPLRRATEQLFEQASEAVSQQSLEGLGDAELESLFESFEPQPGMVAPEFEEFLKKIWKKVKGVAGTAVNLAKKGVGALGKLAAPIGLLLKRLLRLVRPLLNRVIRFALGKLPANLRPLATQLGRRLGILREAGEVEAEAEDEAPTTNEAEAIAQEFDVAVATLLFSRDEVEAEMFIDEATQETLAQESETNPVAEMDAARERFVSQFAELQNGENAAPVVQQFIPAILPVLRIGIRVVGRQKVVKFLASYLARMIQKFVGPTAATPLSRALVDAGLRLIMLEATMESPTRIAARAVAATLEDSVRRVAHFGFQHFDNLDVNNDQQRLLETIANEAFFEAVVNHFPAQLLDVNRLEEREMYLESPTQNEVWAYRPLPRYKKYTKVFEVRIRPVDAKVLTFGQQPLDAFLRARGVQLPATVRIHLYEAIPGTTLSHISSLERGVPGLGSGSQDAWSKIHPLTPDAAQSLLKNRDLGREVDNRWLQSRNLISVGQRFYYIEMGGGGRVPMVCPPSQVNMTVDLKGSQVRVSAYLGETDAQKIASTSSMVSSQTAAQYIMSLAGSVVFSLRNGPSQRVRFLREASGEFEDFAPGAILGAAAAKAAQELLTRILVALGTALLKLLKAAIIIYINSRFDEFKKVARDPKCGLTLVFTFNHPGLRALHVLLDKRLPGPSDAAAAFRAMQPPSVAIVAGFVWS